MAVAPSFQAYFACVHMYILYACVYVCVCVYVCGYDICICMHVCMYLYIWECGLRKSSWRRPLILGLVVRACGFGVRVCGWWSERGSPTRRGNWEGE